MRRQADVLVVDDEVEIVNLLLELLAEEGYAVESVRDAAGALATVRAHPPRLLLLDYSMPGMTGGEIVARLRDDGFDTLPIVIMTASTRSEALEVAGVSDFLAKPFDLDTLLACVGRFVTPASDDRAFSV